MTVFFLDFEASSLLPGSFPIEIGWCDGHGVGEEHLIQPQPGWTDWDYNSQAIHGLTHGDLDVKGLPAADVARRVVEVLAGHEVYSDAPGWDGTWLDRLLEAGGYPSGAVRLLDVAQAWGAACRPLLAGLPPRDDRRHGLELAKRQRRMLQIVGEAQVAEEAHAQRRHRALADAQSLWRTWSDINRRVEEALRDPG